MAKILVVANPVTPHTRARGVVGHEKGHKVFWVSTPKIDLSNVTAFGTTTSSRFNSVFLEPIILVKAILQVKPDLIHVHYARQGLRTPVLLASQCPLIVSTMGGDILPEQGYQGIHVPLVKSLLKRANIITSKSDFMDAALCRIGNYESKIRRVTWGIDLNKFCPNRDIDYLRKKWQIPSTDLVFFDCRGASPLYNKHLILTAFAEYLQSNSPPATLLITEFNAEKHYLTQLRRQVDELGLAENVRFVGSLNYTDIPDYYALADVTISIPHSDGLPQTIFEALACGSFLVLGNLPQYAGTIEDNVTGRLVSFNSKSVAEALVWIANHPEVRRRCVDIGRHYVSQVADKKEQSEFVNQLYVDLLS